MNLQFRNITADPASTPPSKWGVEGFLTALERGTVRDWAKMVAAAHDNAEVTEELEQALRLCELRPAVFWVRTKLKQRQQTPEERVAHLLRLAVLRSGLTQAEFARRVGTSPSRLSTYLGCKVQPSSAFMLRATDVAADAAWEMWVEPKTP